MAYFTSLVIAIDSVMNVQHKLEQEDLIWGHWGRGREALFPQGLEPPGFTRKGRTYLRTKSMQREAKSGSGDG
jgi:hypothetical protein